MRCDHPSEWHRSGHWVKGQDSCRKLNIRIKERHRLILKWAMWDLLLLHDHPMWHCSNDPIVHLCTMIFSCANIVQLTYSILCYSLKCWLKRSNRASKRTRIVFFVIDMFDILITDSCVSWYFRYLPSLVSHGLYLFNQSWSMSIASVQHTLVKISTTTILITR
jgi:hypothetical protein